MAGRLAAHCSSSLSLTRPHVTSPQQARLQAYLGIWGPLAVPDTGLACVCAPVETIVIVALSKLLQAALVGLDGVTDVAEDIPAVPARRVGQQGVSCGSRVCCSWLH